MIQICLPTDWTLTAHADDSRTLAESTRARLVEAESAWAAAEGARAVQELARSEADGARKDAEGASAALQRELGAAQAQAAAELLARTSLEQERDSVTSEAGAARADAEGLREGAAALRTELERAAADAERARELISALRAELATVRALAARAEAARELVVALRAELARTEAAASADATKLDSARALAEAEADRAREAALVLGAQLEGATRAESAAKVDAARVRQVTVTLRAELDAAVTCTAAAAAAAALAGPPAAVAATRRSDVSTQASACARDEGVQTGAPGGTLRAGGSQTDPARTSVAAVQVEPPPRPPPSVGVQACPPPVAASSQTDSAPGTEGTRRPGSAGGDAPPSSPPPSTPRLAAGLTPGLSPGEAAHARPSLDSPFGNAPLEPFGGFPFGGAAVSSPFRNAADNVLAGVSHAQGVAAALGSSLSPTRPASPPLLSPSSAHTRAPGESRLQPGEPGFYGAAVEIWPQHVQSRRRTESSALGTPSLPWQQPSFAGSHQLETQHGSAAGAEAARWAAPVAWPPSPHAHAALIPARVAERLSALRAESDASAHRAQYWLHQYREAERLQGG
ncbi:hypothetical protein T492DRAFT_836477 [Pavlovales sp. CCMP2436]|nr:hypothetical protein T492DRAFT_836477 [Pavlovales sp. CCMP2436]